jgi:hypothetical protein
VAGTVIVVLVTPGLERKLNTAAVADLVIVEAVVPALATYVNSATVADVVNPGGTTPKIQPELFPPSVLSMFAYQVDELGVA